MKEIADAGSLALCFAIGLIAGTLFFASLWRNTALYARPQGLARAIALQALRLAALAAVLALLARQGAPALLVGTLGLLLARRILLRRIAGTAR